MTTILRFPSVLARCGKTRSPLYADIASGVFVRPVKLGLRACGFPEHEVEAIIGARIAGKSDADIRALVERLHEARTAAMPLAS